MAAQQNNEIYKLSELFNVKDKGMLFDYQCIYRYRSLTYNSQLS